MSYDDKGIWTDDPKLVELHALAKAIAKALPYEKGQFGWEYHKKDNQNTDGGRVYLHYNARISKDKLSILIERKNNGTHVSLKSVCDSHTSKGRQYVRSEPCPDISAAISKGADGIARDIEKRLLPELIRVAADTAKKIAEWDAHESAHASAIESVRLAAGESRLYDGNKVYFSTHHVSPHTKEESINVSTDTRIDSGTSCRMTVSCTPDQACALIAFIRNMK